MRRNREEVNFNHKNIPGQGKPNMSEAADKTKPDILSYMQTCNIKGRVGRFYVVKLCPRMARVIPCDMPNGVSFFVDKADLRNIEHPEPGLFPSVEEEIPDSANDKHQGSAPTKCRSG